MRLIESLEAIKVGSFLIANPINCETNCTKDAVAKFDDYDSKSTACSPKTDRYGEFTGPRRLCTNEDHFVNGTLKDINNTEAPIPYAKVVYWSDRCTKV